MSEKKPILSTLLEGTRVGCVATEGAAGATDSRSSAPCPRSLWWRPKEMAARVWGQASRARAVRLTLTRARSPISVTSVTSFSRQRLDSASKKKKSRKLQLQIRFGNVPAACVFS